MPWSPQMQRWMRDAPQHGMYLKLYKSKRFSAGKVRRPPGIPDEALLTENIQQMLTQDQINILLTDGFIDTEGTDPITTEGGDSLII